MGAAGSVETTFEAIHRLDIEISNVHTGDFGSEDYTSWKSFNDIDQSDISIIYGNKQLSFHIAEIRAQQNNMGIVANVDIQWPDVSLGKSKMPYRFLKLTTFGTAMFSQKKYRSAENCARLLTIAETLYAAYRPRFGWIERNLESGYTTKGHSSRLEIPHIYWANFFGREYLDSYGRDFFERAPGSICRLLDDGGCMYVLSPDINRNRAGMKSLEEEVKRYFSVAAVRKLKKSRKRSRGKPDRATWDYTNHLEILAKTIYSRRTDRSNLN